MKLRTLAFCAYICSIAAITYPGSLFAQSSTGTIEGTVLDGTKHPVYNAQIIVTQENTNYSTAIRTTQAGVYSLPGLDSGTYDIEVHADSFSSQKVSAINLDVGGVTTQNFILKAGSSVVSVTVYADSELAQRDTSSVGGVISQDLTNSIPLPDQSSLGLATLIPGVQGDPIYANGVQSELPGIYTSPVIPGAAISIAGSRPGYGSQLVDGFDITQAGYPRAGITFTPQSIKQISVQMAGLPAEYGRSGGGIINQASQGGGSLFHGTLNYRHTDPGIGQAYNWGSIVRPDHHQTIIGGSISGPVMLPKVGTLKDTFFLFAYQPLRGHDVTFTRQRVETPAELSGDLSGSLDVLNAQTLAQQGYAIAKENAQQLVYIYGLNEQNFPSGPQISNGIYQPIPNNNLTAQVAQNPLAKYLQANSPTPTNPGKYLVFFHPDASYDADGKNAYAARGVFNKDDRYNIRVDHTFRNADHLFVRYTYVPVSGVRYNYFGPDNPLDQIPTDILTSRNIAVNYVHLFRGDIVNEFRASYIRGNRERTPNPASLTQDYGAGIGLVTATNGVGFPSISFSGGNSPNTLGTIGGGGSFQDGGRSLDQTYGYGDEVTFIKGRHQIKFGVEFRAIQLDRTDVSNDYGGTYTFNASQTGGSYKMSNGQNSPVSAGSAIASLELGLIYNFTTAGSYPFYYRWKYFAGFIQDDWKVLPNLTINIGLRYNLEFPRSEKFDMQGSFDPNVTGTLNNQAVIGGLVRSGTYGQPHSLFPVSYKGLEPRIGLSYSPREFIIIKTSYALIHTPLTGVSNSIFPTFAPASESIGPLTGGVNTALCPSCPLDMITNAPAPIVRVGAVTGQNTMFTYSQSAFLPYVDQSSSVPYVQIWNFGLEFLVGKNTLLDATYVGQHGVHLFSPQLSTNLPPYDQAISLLKQHYNFGATVANKYGLGSESQLQALEPYQQVFNNPINSAFGRQASSNYNGVYLSAREQLTKSLSVIGGFTWQKSLDTNSVSSVDGISVDSFSIVYPQNPYTLQGDYGVSGFDQPVRTTLGYVYDLPFGQNRRWLSKRSVARAVLSGFQTSGYFSSQSGYPLPISLGNNGYFVSSPVGSNEWAHFDQYGQALENTHLRPNIIPGVPLINPDWKNDKLGVKTGKGFINQNAFTVPGSLDNPQFGTAPRVLSNARNPRSINWDASVRKSQTIHERLVLELKADIQNVANHPNFFLSTSGFQPFTGATISNIALGPGPYGPYQQAGSFAIPSNTNSPRVINLGASLIF